MSMILIGFILLFQICFDGRIVRGVGVIGKIGSGVGTRRLVGSRNRKVAMQVDRGRASAAKTEYFNESDGAKSTRFSPGHLQPAHSSLLIRDFLPAAWHSSAWPHLCVSSTELNLY